LVSLLVETLKISPSGDNFQLMLIEISKVESSLTSVRYGRRSDGSCGAAFVRYVSKASKETTQGLIVDANDLALKAANG
jgi:hypothetical protein